MYDDIDYSVDSGIGTITINRPDVANAFRSQTVVELNDALRAAKEGEALDALVLTGAGDAFCAGADVSEMPDWADMTKEDYAGFLWSVQNVVRQIRSMNTPSIAAVPGPAVGAGCDFALACDVRIVGPEALFREGFVRLGLIPGDGGAWLLPRLIGESAARYYLLTGEDIPAEEAIDLGLAIDHDNAPREAARDLAEQLLKLPTRAVRRTNDLIDPHQDFESYCERAIEYQWECVNDDEHHEALTAFNEGRKPSYWRSYE